MNSGRKIQRPSLVRRWQETISRHRGMHDPMLVFNMSILNSTERQAGIFDQFKIHENGT